MARRTFAWLALAVAIVTAGFYLYRVFRPNAARRALFLAWLGSPASHPDWKLAAGSRCGDAPFIFPTDGMVGFLWDDSFQLGHRHQGIDIFGGTAVDATRVIAAYPGYLTRPSAWKSSVIVRVPGDPLQPERQIWLYYTHMADQNGHSFIAPEFPPGTAERPIDAGVLIGYQGDYSGDPHNPVGVHLHFSIVKDDGKGRFSNELNIENTYDPSPYLGLPLNAGQNHDRVPVCGG